MPKITVRFYTLLRDLLGTDSADLEAEDLDEAINHLEREFGSQLEEQLGAYRMGEGTILQGSCLLLLNGRSVDRQNPEQIKLNSGDILHVFPPVAGG